MRTDGWVEALQLKRDSNRDHVVVLADSPLRDLLTRAVADNGFQVIAARTPLDAIQILERLGSSIAYVVLAVAHALRDVLAEDYPQIRPVVLVA